MKLARRRISTLGLALLFLLASMGLNAAPASAADWRKVGMYATKSACNNVRHEFQRYYRVGICLFDAGTPRGFYFMYDRDS